MTTSGRSTTSVRTRRRAGALAVIGLGAAGAIHAAWALGSTWPAEDQEHLADVVAGRQPFPGPGPSWVVAGLLGTAAGITAVRSGLVRAPIGPDSFVIRAGSSVVASTLLARGAVGLVISGLDRQATSPAFRRWNLRLYSPLCLGLGAAVTAASRR